MRIITTSLLASFILFGCGNEETTEESKGSESAPQSAKIEDGMYPLMGTIADGLDIRMFFDLANNQLSGAYYYMSRLTEMEITGETKGDSLIVHEFWKGLETGTFRGVFDGNVYKGIWTGNHGIEHPFHLEKTDMEYYTAPLPEGPEDGGELELAWSWDDFKGMFEKIELPLEFDETWRAIDEEEYFDSTMVQEFINEDYSAEWIGEFYNPGFWYEMPQYDAYVFNYHYYPGAFGVHNNTVMLMTVDHLGNRIDIKEIGCFCYDSNQAGMYYDAVYPSFLFDGSTITVDNIYESGTNFPDELPEGEEVIDQRSEGTTTFQVSASGVITKVSGD